MLDRGRNVELLWIKREQVAVGDRLECIRRRRPVSPETGAAASSPNHPAVVDKLDAVNDEEIARGPVRSR